MTDAIVRYTAWRRVARITTLALTVLVTLAACGGEEAAATRSIEEIHREEGVPVRVRAVESATFRTWLGFTGTLSGAAESTATASLADEVEAVRAEVGDFVERGTVIVEFPLDNPTLNWEQARVSYQSALTAFERVERLFADEGISRQAYDDARTQLDLARANWESVQQLARVTAPISGFITRIHVVESDNVGPGDPLFTVSDYRRLRTTVWLTDRQVTAVRAGQPATAEWQDITLEGSVQQVDISMDPDRMAFGARIAFDNADRTVPSGVTASLRVETYRNDDALILNQREVLESPDGTYVYLVENATAVRRPVTVARRQGLQLEIESGLMPGDQVVVQGIDLVDEGTLVRIVGRDERLVQN